MKLQSDLKGTLSPQHLELHFSETCLCKSSQYGGPSHLYNGKLWNPSYGEKLHFMISHCIRVRALRLPHWHILVLMPSNALIARYYTLEVVTVGTHEKKGFLKICYEIIAY